jgi:hypothetical protein
MGSFALRNVINSTNEWGLLVGESQGRAMIFDVRGDHVLHQSNGFNVELHLEQRFPGGPEPDEASEVLRGRAMTHNPFVESTALEGRVNERNFFLLITWSNGSQGEYHGQFVPPGRLSGVAFDLKHPESQATWFIDRDFRIF